MSSELVAIKCPHCGSAVLVEEKKDATEDDWLECLPLDKAVAKIPVGYRSYPTGEIYWVDANGQVLSPAAYKKMHGVDPERVWVAMGKTVKKY